LADDIATIYAVDEVRLTLLKSNPPSLVITSTGRTTSSGWSNGRLSRYVYIVPPADGIQEFDFVATPPAATNVVLPVLTPITAEVSIAAFDEANFWGPGKPLLGVRVYAATNAKTSLFATKPGMLPVKIVPVDPPPPAKLSFETDIKGLFRPVPDVESMSFKFDLHSHADVSANAEDIERRLTATNPARLMPCDGAWPKTDIEKFQKWIADGKLP
jgi:hypothetical protein